jgi:hypothetical protein
MPNTQTSVPAFTAGQVLTAAQMTEVNTGIPVFATTTTRDAAFGGTGEKTLAEGQFAYIEATNTTQYYDGAAWQTLVVGGLTLVKTQTIGSGVSSVAVTDAFSATYDNYKIVISGGVGSTEAELNMILTGSTSGYYWGEIHTNYSSTSAVNGGSNTTKWDYCGAASTNVLAMNMELQNPFLAKYTNFQASIQRAGIQGFCSGYHAVATSYTGFTIAPFAGTLTGGTIRVYGYANS